MALALAAGCSSRPERRDCVDGADRIASNQNCENYQELEYRKKTVGQPYFRYLYGGSSGGHMGDMVSGGSPTPRSGGS